MAATDPEGYPAQLISDVVLSDGGTVHVRPIRPDDGPALVRLHSRLSPESIYLRWFSVHPRLSETELRYLTNVDYVHRLALVAELGDEVVAVARYEGRPGSDDAEVAFVVDDAHQGRGIATLLLEHLAVAAHVNGKREFYATALWDNIRMRDVFRDAGFDSTRKLDSGELHIRFPVERTEALARAVAAREHQAEARSVARLLSPRSIAVVGAGRERGGLGHEVFRNLVVGGFDGLVYPVNSEATHVSGVRAYPTVADIDGPVDLAVVCIPAPGVPEVVEQCAAKGVYGVALLAAGFADVGGEGTLAERDLVRLARRHGMRVIGPNSMGLVNTAVSMNATAAPVAPASGPVGFASQSGALGTAILERSARLGLGFSVFVSLGNKADVSTNDLLQYWEDDPGTEVVLLHLESFGNPAKFNRLARRVSSRKPIVTVKSGRRGEGPAGVPTDLIVDALFRQTGVLRVATLEELFGVAQVLAHQPLPPGRRVAILVNGGGPGVLAADACEAAGLVLAELSEPTRIGLEALLPAGAGLANPVDMLADATAADYRDALALLLADPGIDAVIAIFAPPLVTGLDEVARAIASAETILKPVVANFLGVEGVPQALRHGAGQGPLIPSFPFPEAAAQALGRAAGYADWRRRTASGPVGPPPGTDPIAALAVARDALRENGSGLALDPEQAAAVLGAFGIVAAPADANLRLLQDPSFGPLVIVESAGSTAVVIVPVDHADAEHALRLSLRRTPPPAEIGYLVDVVVRLGFLGEQVPEVSEVLLDLSDPKSEPTVRVAAPAHQTGDLRRLR
jgi:acyl-CoA synthetase (NDP forming)/GNAT superfamily N-acetyltransferase